MIYEVAPDRPIGLNALLALSIELEDERNAAKATIRQEIRDRHEAALLLIEAQANAPNRTSYELFRRSTRKLEKYTDMLFTLLEVM